MALKREIRGCQKSKDTGRCHRARFEFWRDKVLILSKCQYWTLIGIVKPTGPSQGKIANNSVRVSDDFLRAVKGDATWDLIRRVDGSIAKSCARPVIIWHQNRTG